MKSTIEDNTSLSAAYKKRLLSPGDVFSLLVFGPDESLERRVGLGSSESLGDIGLKHCAGATVAHLFDRGHLDIRKTGWKLKLCVSRSTSFFTKRRETNQDTFRIALLLTTSNLCEKCWATRSSARSFARSALSSACSAKPAHSLPTVPSKEREFSLTNWMRRFHTVPTHGASLLIYNPLKLTCSGVHVSKLTDLTLEMWTPKFLWIPAQRMQRKMPRFHDAHRGPLASQSTQYLLSSSRSKLLDDMEIVILNLTSISTYLSLGHGTEVTFYMRHTRE